MTTRTTLAVLLVACGHAAAPAPTTPAAPTPDPAFEPVHPLLGTWTGTDPDKHSTGTFSLEPALGGKILLRRNTNDSAEGHHEDLMIVFATPAGLRASYYDNEGHVIAYTITAAADHIELQSDDVPGQPRFRLRYDIKGPDELAIDFAIAMPGNPELKHYAGGTVHRVK
jgi:hypothetical protein